MRILFVSLAIFAGALLLPCVSYSQQLNERELKIYYDFVENSWALIDDTSLNQEDFKKAMQKLYADIGAKYGISGGAVEDIEKRAWEYGITPAEQQILNELQSRLSVLAKPQIGAPTAEWTSFTDKETKIIQEVADKYGITYNVLCDIEDRAKKQTKK